MRNEQTTCNFLKIANINLHEIRCRFALIIATIIIAKNLKLSLWLRLKVKGSNPDRERYSITDDCKSFRNWLKLHSLEPRNGV